MTPENFVNGILQSIVEENLRIYREFFSSAEAREFADPYSVRATALFDRLGSADCETLLEIVRQTMVDTLSSVFGVLDGVSNLNCEAHEFTLTVDSDSILNGDLQDLFLAMEEDAEAGR